MSDPLKDPRVKVDEYIVVPSCWDDLPEYDRDSFGLTVRNGHKWGWSIQDGIGRSGGRAMNRKGEFIWERRGHGANRFRRYPLEEALELALKYVETRTVMGLTAQQFADRYKEEKV